MSSVDNNTTDAESDVVSLGQPTLSSVSQSQNTVQLTSREEENQHRTREYLKRLNDDLTVTSPITKRKCTALATPEGRVFYVK